MKGKGEHYTYWLESATESNPFANPAALKELSGEAKQLINSERWKMRRYFQDDTSSTLTTLESLTDLSTQDSSTVRDDDIDKIAHTAFALTASDDVSVCSIHSYGSAFSDRINDAGAIIGFSEELLSKSASEWQDMNLNDSLTDDAIQSKVFDALFGTLAECVDKGGKRLDVV